MATSSSKSSSSSFSGDFEPGEVLIGRYRIVALVGEGGMGQVYLANDLVLDQEVALKFLPAHLAEREDGLERFRAEVRHAREVTHPNVARVHDIGEVDGRHFLTMEFVDGEDLASLVRRIGRLPREKAAEIAQQICAGLGEAHRKGLLHRDLKPANVMLDGEGRVRLTDFGLSVAAEAAGDSAVAGTPMYMAPEQLLGLPATVRSEIYSVGLVLYELYTGRRALRGRTIDELRREHEERPIDSASSVLRDIDPEVEAILARCLARDPAERPASVSEVARALPGGDPLAAALAAGETPAPAVVAAADVRGALSPRVALALLVGFCALLVAYVLGNAAWLREQGVHYGKPEAVLRERARELSHALTGRAEHADEADWYEARSEQAKKLRSALGAHAPYDPQPLLHVTRLAGAPLVSPSGWIDMRLPPAEPGSSMVVLDSTGRLVSWSQLLERDAKPEPGARVPESVWNDLIERAGLDANALQPAEPRGLPSVACSERRAWESAATPELRVEAAALDGHPMRFDLEFEDRPFGGADDPVQGGEAFRFVLLGLTGAAAVFAWRNLRARRADLRGALAVGSFVFATHLVLAFVGAVPGTADALGVRFDEVLAMALHTGVRVLLVYLALEPFARRHWPGKLVAWTRLLHGRWRDPLVGREMLVGLVTGAVLILLALAAEASGALSAPGGPPLAVSGLAGPIESLSATLHLMGDAVMFGGLLVFLLVLVRSIVPVPWLGNLLWIAAGVALSSIGQSFDPFRMGSNVVFSLVLLLLLTRLGFLAVIGFMVATSVPPTLTLSLNPADWYFSSSLFCIAVLVGLAALAYRNVVAERPALR